MLIYLRILELYWFVRVYMIHVGLNEYRNQWVHVEAAEMINTNYMWDYICYSHDGWLINDDDSWLTLVNMWKSCVRNERKFNDCNSTD
jgi:hypothetical protein